MSLSFAHLRSAPVSSHPCNPCPGLECGSVSPKKELGCQTIRPSCIKGMAPSRGSRRAEEERDTVMCLSGTCHVGERQLVVQLVQLLLISNHRGPEKMEEPRKLKCKRDKEKEAGWKRGIRRAQPSASSCKLSRQKGSRWDAGAKACKTINPISQERRDKAKKPESRIFHKAKAPALVSNKK